MEDGRKHHCYVVCYAHVTFVTTNKFVDQPNPNSTTDMSNEHSELLKLLQTHGEQFLASFSLSSASTTSRKRKINDHSPKVPIEDDEEEWGGIVQDSNSDSKADGDHPIFSMNTL